MSKNNLVHNSDTKVEVYPSSSYGLANKSVSILCECLPILENSSLDMYSSKLTYDTFQSLGNKEGQNYYAISWDKAVEINQIVLTMGFPYTDGGWWTSLVLEYKRHRSSSWEAISNSHFSPKYNFTDTSFGRFPFEKYIINFPKLKISAIRLNGCGGGFSSFTSMSCIEAYLVESDILEKLKVRNYPIPKLYNLISPDKIWNLSNCLYKATGLYLLTEQLQYYLNIKSFKEFQLAYEPQFTTPALWRLLNDKEHWENYKKEPVSDKIVIEKFFGNMFAQIRGPILKDGLSMGSFLTDPPILLDNIDMEKHKSLAEDFEFDWETYEDSMKKTISMSLERVDGIASLVGYLINELIHQVQHEQIFNRTELKSNIRRESLIQDAMTIMEQDLELGICIDSLLDKLHVSYRQLSEAFKKSLDTTPSKVLFELKLNRAKEYLADERLRILDIAGSLGYTENHFIRSFKNEVGQTPGEYRKSIMKSE